MFRRYSTAKGKYPRQFWLLFYGMMISTIGTSMIWPFLTIYVSERLAVPLTTVTSLLTLNAAMGLISSFLAGPITDKAGRKWVMAISLLVNGLAYLFMSSASTLGEFAVLMSITGAFNPLYRVGADAMMADLIPPRDRVDAYSLLRTSNNIGVALGPSIGGFIATQSYGMAFYIAATGLILYSLLVTFFAHETLSPEVKGAVRQQKERFGGYGKIFRDRPFLSFIGAFTLTQCCSALIWTLLAVYSKQNYGVSENVYGFIPTTNALMVILFQYSLTQVTKRYPPLFAIGVGTAFYALALFGVSQGTGFWAFWVSMVIMTIGELILSPTSTTYAANMAPADMRGRYMSLFSLTHGVSSGIAPLFGGILNDTISPQAVWYGGGVVGLFSTLVFFYLNHRDRLNQEQEQVAKPS